VDILIAFRYGDDRWFARLICWWRGGDSAHCEVVVPKHSGEFDGEQPQDCITASWLDGGVRYKVMPLPADKWRVYAVEGTRDPVSWLVAHDHHPYGWRSLLGFVLPPLLRKPRGWICTRVAAHMMGLPAEHTHDLVAIESVCERYGTRIQ
jgi:hypothetical protein